MSNCPCDSVIFPPGLSIPAGLTTFERQIATFPEFREAMLASIRTKPALDAWRARQGGDFGLMLLEMWAYICDSISFYDELIAHENYIGTARLRPSVRKLVGLLGYIPRPAVAATVNLAALADGRKAVILPAGAAFRSGAFSGNPPQVFELDSETIIHPFFNRWDVTPNRPTTIGGSQTYLLLNPANAAVKQDDVLLLIKPGPNAIVTAKSVAAYTGKDGGSYTKVDLPAPVSFQENSSVSELQLLKPSTTASLWDAPSTATNAITTPYVEVGLGWALRTIVRLDSVNRQVRAGQFILLSKGDEYRWFRVDIVKQINVEISPETTSTLTDADGDDSTITTPAVMAPITQLRLDSTLSNASRSSTGSTVEWTNDDAANIVVHLGLVSAGSVTVEANSQVVSTEPFVVAGPLELPESPAPPSLFQMLDKNALGAEIGGTLDFTTGVLATDQGAGFSPLAVPVSLYGNIISASRGETVNGEILGTGDGSASHQSFTLKKKPLTYIPSPTAGNESGAANTLKVYVGGVLWSEVSNFYGVAPEARVYIVRQDDEQNTIITFGDGVRGSRLPTGLSVVAYYRFGAGATSPPSGSITQLAKAVPGVKSVKNPVAASGGSDAEAAENIQTYAPRSALLLGRAVSIQDFEAAAAAQGVRGVSAEWRWNQEKQRPVVQIYYIGEAGIQDQIAQTLRGMADPSTPISVTQAVAAPRELSLDIEIDPLYLEDDVVARVRDALLNPAYGLLAPERIGIGKPLYRSRIFTTVLSVAGALAVRSIQLGSFPFLVFAVTPGAGKYFDFETGGVILNGQAVANV